MGCMGARLFRRGYYLFFVGGCGDLRRGQLCIMVLRRGLERFQFLSFTVSTLCEIYVVCVPCLERQGVHCSTNASMPSGQSDT